MDSKEGYPTSWFLERSNSLDPTYHERTTASQAMGPTLFQPDRHQNHEDPQTPTNPPVNGGRDPYSFKCPLPPNQQLMIPQDFNRGQQIQHGLPESINGAYITNPYPNDGPYSIPRCLLKDGEPQNAYSADGYQRGDMPDGEFKRKGNGRANEAARCDPDRTVRQANHNGLIRSGVMTKFSLHPVREPEIGSMLKLNGKLFEIVGTIFLPTDGSSLMNAGIYILLNPKGILVVQKKVRMATREQQERATYEKRALTQIARAGGHRNINKFYESTWESGSVTASFVVEYCNGGTLADLIAVYYHRNMYIQEVECWQAMYQLSCALTMCHYGIRDITDPTNKIEDWNTICHLDIKPQNIFLDYQKDSNAASGSRVRYVLGDFGGAVTRDDIMSGKMTHRVQPWATDCWIPPENGGINATARDTIGPYGKHTDIWQLGGVIQAMCSRLQTPELPNFDRALGWRAAGDPYGSDLNEMVARCMARDFTSRPQALELALYVKKVVEILEQC